MAQWHGGKVDFVWFSARTPPMGRACGEPNEIKKTAHIRVRFTALSPVVGAHGDGVHTILGQDRDDRPCHARYVAL